MGPVINCTTGESRDHTPEELAAFEARPIPVPQVVSRRQAKLALLDADLLDEADAIIAAADQETQINWADAVEFRREHPLIMAIGGALGMTSGQIDDLFRLAITL